MKDLTKGKPSTLILAFALPIFLGNLLQLTYSVTDTRICLLYTFSEPTRLRRISYAVFCLKKKKNKKNYHYQLTEHIKDCT